jgi:hypothetical protein
MASLILFILAAIGAVTVTAVVIGFAACGRHDALTEGEKLLLKEQRTWATEQPQRSHRFTVSAR